MLPGLEGEEMSVTITNDMMVWNDSTKGLYKHPKEGYVLIDHSTGDGRWMPTRQAKNWLKIMGDKRNEKGYVQSYSIL